MQKLINHNAERPDIGFGSIVVIDEAFRSHVNWTADRYVGKKRFGPDGESKIGDLVVVVGKENIGNFEISMNDKILVEIL